MRAQSPVVNLIGDHATYHRRYDAPLTSDVEGTAPGRVASLILPADEAFRATTADELSRHLRVGLAVQGPALVEVAL